MFGYLDNIKHQKLGTWRSDFTLGLWEEYSQARSQNLGKHGTYGSVESGKEWNFVNRGTLGRMEFREEWNLKKCGIWGSMEPGEAWNLGKHGTRRRL